MARLAVKPLSLTKRASAGAVATLFNFAAIGVVYPITEVDIGRLRFFYHQHLIGTNAEAPVRDELPLRRAEVDLLVDGVDDNKVIAGAMHLGEFDFHTGL